MNDGLTDIKYRHVILGQNTAEGMGYAGAVLAIDADEENLVHGYFQNGKG